MSEVTEKLFESSNVPEPDVYIRGPDGSEVRVHRCPSCGQYPRGAYMRPRTGSTERKPLLGGAYKPGFN